MGEQEVAIVLDALDDEGCGLGRFDDVGAGEHVNRGCAGGPVLEDQFPLDDPRPYPVGAQYRDANGALVAASCNRRVSTMDNAACLLA
jgi:hypothetical protein